MRRLARSYERGLPLWRYPLALLTCWVHGVSSHRWESGNGAGACSGATVVNHHSPSSRSYLHRVANQGPVLMPVMVLGQFNHP